MGTSAMVNGLGCCGRAGSGFPCEDDRDATNPPAGRKAGAPFTSALAMPIALRWVGRQATRGSVSLLRYAWNNDSFSADVDYLMAVAREAEGFAGPFWNVEVGSPRYCSESSRSAVVSRSAPSSMMRNGGPRRSA